MKYVVMTHTGDVWICEADTISEACDKFDWKYPGTVILVMALNVFGDKCPFCGAEMEGQDDGK